MDLSRVKSKLALNMTKRQLICFGSAAAVGIPVYIFTRGVIGNTGAALLMMGPMLPLFFLAMYERDGQPAEIVLRNYIRTKIYWPGIRPYKTENLYELLTQEANNIASRPHERSGREASTQLKNKKAAKAPVSKRPTSKGKPRGLKKDRRKK
jgi:hypothetical protein